MNPLVHSQPSLHLRYVTDTMVGIILRRWFWPKLRDSVRRFIRNCDICGRTSVWREAKAGFLKSLPIPERTGSELTIDFVTDLPLSEGCTNIMVITDRLLKSVTLEPMDKIDAESCAKKFLACYWRFHGFPKAITSDRGTNWTSKFWKRLCELLKIEQRLSTAYHPQTNSQVERINAIIATMLSMYVNEYHSDWDAYLTFVIFAYNTNQQASTKFSPFRVIYGREPQLPEEIQLPPDPQSKALIEVTWPKIREMVKNNLIEAQERYTSNYNEARVAVSYNEGDLVLVRFPNPIPGLATKLLHKYHGPYRIVRKKSELTYELEGIAAGDRQKMTVHVQRLKPFVSRRTEEFDPVTTLTNPPMSSQQMGV